MAGSRVAHATSGHLTTHYAASCIRLAMIDLHAVTLGTCQFCWLTLAPVKSCTSSSSASPCYRTRHINHSCATWAHQPRTTLEQYAHPCLAAAAAGAASLHATCCCHGVTQSDWASLLHMPHIHIIFFGMHGCPRLPVKINAIL